MNLNGTEYYYIRNGQGDIIGLLDGTGAQVVSYTYDSWGKLISTTGSLAATVGVKNLYRYRGYRYDSETGLYYLQSRYYNPEWGRFISSDDTDVLDVPDDKNKLDILDTNLFAYCLNNPINMNDPNGKLAFLIPIIVTAPTWVPWVVGGVLALGTAITLDAAGLNPFRYAKTKRKSKEKSKEKPRSEGRIGHRVKTKSKKEAYERAKRAGKGKKPIHHTDHGRPHYHPDVKPGIPKTPKQPYSHDHYYY